MSDEYDFSELQARWRAASSAASMCASDGDEEPHAALGLFLGSIIEEGFEELASALEMPVSTGPVRDYFDDEDDREVPVGPIVLKGRNPVSLLHEICQSRGWPNPTFDITQTGESHVPIFNGSVTIGEASGNPPMTVYVGDAKSKAELKKALAKKMLVAEFGAQEDYT